LCKVVGLYYIFCMTLTAKFGALPDDHVPDVLDHGLSREFCGTALGRQSAQRRAYYANPGNFFWRAVHEAGFTRMRFRPDGYAQTQELGIRLTSLCKTAYGNGGELPDDAFDRIALEAKILRYQPKILAFTGKTGAASYLHKPTGMV